MESKIDDIDKSVTDTLASQETANTVRINEIKHATESDHAAFVAKMKDDLPPKYNDTALRTKITTVETAHKNLSQCFYSSKGEATKRQQELLHQLRKLSDDRQKLIDDVTTTRIDELSGRINDTVNRCNEVYEKFTTSFTTYCQKYIKFSSGSRSRPPTPPHDVPSSSRFNSPPSSPITTTSNDNHSHTTVPAKPKSSKVLPPLGTYMDSVNSSYSNAGEEPDGVPPLQKVTPLRGSTNCTAHDRWHNVDRSGISLGHKRSSYQYDNLPCSSLFGEAPSSLFGEDTPRLSNKYDNFQPSSSHSYCASDNLTKSSVFPYDGPGNMFKPHPYQLRTTSTASVSFSLYTYGPYGHKILRDETTFLDSLGFMNTTIPPADLEALLVTHKTIVSNWSGRANTGVKLKNLFLKTSFPNLNDLTEEAVITFYEDIRVCILPYNIALTPFNAIHDIQRLKTFILSPPGLGDHRYAAMKTALFQMLVSHLPRENKKICNIISLFSQHGSDGYALIWNLFYLLIPGFDNNKTRRAPLWANHGNLPSFANAYGVYLRVERVLGRLPSP